MSDIHTLRDPMKQALHCLRIDQSTRSKVIEVLLDYERRNQKIGQNLREDVTGPIVDELFDESELLKKRIKSGLIFHFRYTSKIARDFLLAPSDTDHVWEPQTTKLGLAIASNASAIGIGGAYFGDHAILLAAKMRERGGACHCFELDSNSVELLLQNAQINGLENVIVNRLALWDKDRARIELKGSDAHASPSETVKASGDRVYHTITLDTYFQRLNVAHVDLLMLDIEGGEIKALLGAQKLLGLVCHEAPDIIFEIHRAYVDWSEGLHRTAAVELLEKFGYHVFAIRDYQGNVPMGDIPVEIIPAREVYLEGPPHGFNMFATKDLDQIATLGLRCCKGVSPKLLFHRDPRLHQPLHKS